MRWRPESGSFAELLLVLTGSIVLPILGFALICFVFAITCFVIWYVGVWVWHAALWIYGILPMPAGVP